MKEILFKIVYLLIVLFISFFGFKSSLQKNNTYKDILKEVVVLEGTKILPENEGKLVLISGKLESEDILEFNNFDIKVETPILKSRVEMLQYVKDGSGKGVIQRWSNKEPELSVRDEETGRTYYNEVKELKDEAIYGNAKLGEFELGPEVLQIINTNTIYTDLKDIGDYRVLKEGELTNSSEEEAPGDYKITFRYLDLEEDYDYTLIGKQVNNTLTEYELELGTYFFKSYKGKLTFDDIYKQIQKERNLQILIRLGYVALILGVGAVLMKIPAEKFNFNQKDKEVKEEIEIEEKDDMDEN